MWRTLAKLAVSSVLIWAVLRTQDIDALMHEIATVDRGALILSILLILTMTILLALRWSAILATMGKVVAFRVTFPLVMVGLFFNQGLPSSMGDVVRIWLAHRAGLPAAASFNSVMLDRLIGLFALFVMVTAGLPHLFALAPGPAVTHGVLMTVLIGYGGFVFTALLHHLPKSLARFRIARLVIQFSTDLRGLLRSPRAAALVLIYGLVIQAGSVVAVYALARGLGLDVNMLDCLLIVPLANLIQSVPISIAGWGVREGFFVAAFGITGLAAPSALAISVLYGLVTAVASLPGGLVWLLRGRSKVNKPSLDAM